ncbi:hypothetical protein BD626DRAFT_503595 [Schizophyllum amplum]|uniref:F-box domain-containing protein n=1 Tax=Schizophyllum amplum TaxID=97359 RepID=A0A550C7N0_9AGAR|nr:hypothetical protein BD626DRAFT_503595 [Auriculariopsis ampla]
MSSSDVDPMGRRASARLKRRASTDSPPESLSSTRSVKRCKAAYKNAREEGPLEDLPVELLYETFAYLHPIDLLNVAQTSRALKSVVMDQAFSSVWKASLATLHGRWNMPPAPEGRSQAEHANLLFGDTCIFCWTARSTVTAWSLNARFCRECASTGKDVLKIDFENITRKQPLILRLPDIGDLLNYGYDECEDIFYVLTKDLEVRNTEYLAVRRTAAVETWKTKCRALVGDRRNFASWCADVRTLELSARERKRSRLHYGRQSEIEDFLIDAGFKDDLYPFWHDLQYEHPLLDRVELLNEQGISDLQDELVEIFEPRQAQRLEHEHQRFLLRYYADMDARWKSYVNQLPPQDVHPPVCDVFLSLPYQQFAVDTPIHTGIWSMHLKLLFSRVPALVTRWRAEKDAELVDIMSKAFGRRSTVQELQLATTFFQCNASGKSLAEVSSVGYPRILVTPHASRAYIREDEPDEMVRSLQKTPWNWKGERVAFDEAAHSVARDVVALCGLEPDKATASDMEVRGAWLACTGCSKRGHPRVMQWYQAVRHARPGAGPSLLCKSGKPSFSVLDEAKVPRAVALRDRKWRVPGAPRGKSKNKRRDDTVNIISVRMMCAHCKDIVTSFDVATHMQHEHEILHVRLTDVVLPLDEADTGEYVM